MSANSQLREHRWGHRVVLNAPAELATIDGVSADARVRDASISGAFVETTARLPPLSRVSVRPRTRAGEWLDGWVVRTDGTGVGIEWLDPGLRAVSALLSLHYSPSEAAIETAPKPGSSIFEITPSARRRGS